MTHMSTNNFNVFVPIEHIEKWVREAGVEDGMILENQEVSITNLDFNETTGYVSVSGNLHTKRLDS